MFHPQIWVEIKWADICTAASGKTCIFFQCCSLSHTHCSLSCMRKLITGSSTAHWERIAHSPPATGVQISEVLSFLIYKGEVGTGVLWACCSFRNLELQVHNLQFFLTFYLLGFSSYLLFLPQVDCNYFLSLVLFKKIAKIPYGLVIDYDSYFRLFFNLRLMNLHLFLITKS